MQMRRVCAITTPILRRRCAFQASKASLYSKAQPAETDGKMETHKDRPRRTEMHA